MGKNKVTRIDPEFPKWETPQTGAGFILGIFLWILMILVFFFMLYSAWFTHNLIYILQLIKPRNYYIPIWLSVLLVIFAFPATLIVILTGTLIRIAKD